MVWGALVECELGGLGGLGGWDWLGLVDLRAVPEFIVEGIVSVCFVDYFLESWGKFLSWWKLVQIWKWRFDFFCGLHLFCSLFRIIFLGIASPHLWYLL